MKNLLKSVGILKYDDNYKLYVDVDDDIAKYYLKMIPKYIATPNPQRYNAHITVVRNEIPKNLENWKKYDNCKITFLYSTVIQTNNIYFWLNVYSEELSNIREELGLQKTSEFSRPPSDEECFHITIGNLK